MTVNAFRVPGRAASSAWWRPPPAEPAAASACARRPAWRAACAGWASRNVLPAALYWQGAPPPTRPPGRPPGRRRCSLAPRRTVGRAAAPPRRPVRQGRRKWAVWEKRAQGCPHSTDRRCRRRSSRAAAALPCRAWTSSPRLRAGWERWRLPCRAATRGLQTSWYGEGQGDPAEEQLLPLLPLAPSCPPPTPPSTRSWCPAGAPQLRRSGRVGRVGRGGDK